MGLLLPPSVVRQVRAERAVEIEMAQRTGVCKEFTRELRHIDPYLELVWWPETASAPGFIPGRYHIVRHNPDAAGSVEPFAGPNGEYREPDSSLFDQVRAADLWNAEVARDRRRMMQAALDAKAKRERDEQAQRREELAERVKAVTETSVSMNTDVPWTQSVNGKRDTSRHAPGSKATQRHTHAGSDGKRRAKPMLDDM